MLLCIFHDFTALVLSEVTTRCTFRTFFQVLAVGIPPFLPVLTCTPCGKVGQAWILLDFDTPSGRIGQVDVQTVELVVCHCINLLLHEVQTEEMTGNIEHHTTIFKARFVGNGTHCHLVRFAGHLQQSLNTIEQTCTRSRFDSHALLGSGQYITFRALHIRQFSHLLQDDSVRTWSFTCYHKLQRRSFEESLKDLLVGFRSFNPQLGLFIYGKCASYDFRSQWHRNNGKRFFRLFTTCKSQSCQHTCHYN